jgi:iron complex outermembrane receptor protein
VQTSDVCVRGTVVGGELFVGLDYSRMLEFKKRELSADGTTLVSRDLTGEYEYPEDSFVLTGDWGFDVWGVRATLNYTGFEGLTIALGIDNALDESPPFAIGDGDTDLYAYVSGTHDPRGRFIYGKVTYRF